MLITLTPAQYAELDNDFWHIPYTVTIDGTEYNAHTDDDDLREIPHNVLVGEPGSPGDDPTEYWIAHPALTWQDEVLIHAELDQRAAFTATVRAAPQPERAGLRQAKRTELRQEARRNARKVARVAQRRRDRRAARADARAELEETHADALEAARPPDEVT